MGGLADRLRGRRVVDAERRALVLADVGVHPGDALARRCARSARGHCSASAVADRYVEHLRERALHDVSRHLSPPDRSRMNVRACARAAHREQHPMLGSAVTYLGPASPRRTASALGLAAGADPELAQDRRDVVVDRPARRARAARRSRRCAAPAATRPSTSTLARASGSRGFCRVADAVPAAAHARRARAVGAPRAPPPAGAQPLQLVEGLPQRRLVVGVRECQRCLVGAAELAPELGRVDRMTGELQRVRLGRLRRDLSPRGRHAVARRRAHRQAMEPSARRRARAGPRSPGSPRRGRLPATRPRLLPPRPARASAARSWAPPGPTLRLAAATPPGRRGGRARAPARRGTRCAAWSMPGECAAPMRRSRPLLTSAPGRARDARGTRAGRDGTAPDRGRCSTRSPLPGACSPRRAGAARQR